ncbi:MAG: SDR family NAD(P)-dependent oxidoreductase [Halobacteriaceae archaeon]
MPAPRYEFDGQTVIVTGGSSGIGRAVARRFGAAGATVLNADIDPEPKDVEATVPTHEVIAEAGGEAAFVETDVGDPEVVEDVVRMAREFGGVDVMVNNAGIFHAGNILELEPEAFQRLLRVNVEGVFNGTQAAAADMCDRGEPGAVINTASISASLAQHDQVGYDATKGAIRMLTRGAALELGAEGVRVNAVAPGQIATELEAGWTAEAEAGGFLKEVPLGRAGRPSDVAGAFLWLASEDAAYVTGELLHVDGGWQVC